MINGSEKENGWLKFKLRSPHVIERCGKAMIMKVINYKCPSQFSL